MSNSSLVNYTKLSPNYSSRDGAKIDKITIHHMAGNLSVETCGGVFARSGARASANYGVGTDGRVGMYVEEKNRAWTSSSYANDRRAVTIEVANDKIGGDWHVSDKALAKTIDLCVDICKRNDIKKINYTGDASGNLTMHCWFAATACPGPYLKSKFSYIAEQINKKLNTTSGLATPKLVSAKTASGGITVKWEKVTDASTYRLFRKIANGKWTKVTDTKKTSFTDKEITKGVYYIYTVRCVSKDGKTYVSSYDKNGIGHAYPLNAPKLISVTANKDSSVTVKFDKVDKVKKYRVFRKSGKGDWEKVADTTSNSYKDKTTASNTKYIYTVRGMDADSKYITKYDTTGLSVTTKSTTKVPYAVQLTKSPVIIYKSHDRASDEVGTITDKGVYTITEVKDGFGKLKSGAGWILLSNTKEV